MIMTSEAGRARLHRTVDGEVAALLGVGGGEAQAVPLLGVRALMLAMLEDAVRVYLGPAPQGRGQAEEWIHSHRRWVFSFSTVCETLGLEPAAVRVALRHLRQSPATGRRVLVGKSRPNARQANLRITLPRVRRRAVRVPG